MEHSHIYFIENNDNGDPVYNGPGWYYSDEAEQMCGPFDTKEKAKSALKWYVDHEL